MEIGDGLPLLFLFSEKNYPVCCELPRKKLMAIMIPGVFEGIFLEIAKSKCDVGMKRQIAIARMKQVELALTKSM